MIGRRRSDLLSQPPGLGYESYLEHQLRRVAIERPCFEPAAVELLASASEGIPRTIPELTGGSKKSVVFVKKHHKPWIHLAAGDQRLKDWLTAGPHSHGCAAGA